MARGKIRQPAFSSSSTPKLTTLRLPELGLRFRAAARAAVNGMFHPLPGSTSDNFGHLPHPPGNGVNRGPGFKGAGESARMRSRARPVAGPGSPPGERACSPPPRMSSESCSAPATGAPGLPIPERGTADVRLLRHSRLSRDDGEPGDLRRPPHAAAPGTGCGGHGHLRRALPPEEGDRPRQRHLPEAQHAAPAGIDGDRPCPLPHLRGRYGRGRPAVPGALPLRDRDGPQREHHELQRARCSTRPAMSRLS
jgi:hypothetical protein